MGAVGIFPYAAVTGNIGPERFVNEITRIGKQCCWRIIVMFEQIFINRMNLSSSKDDSNVSLMRFIACSLVIIGYSLNKVTR